MADVSLGFFLTHMNQLPYLVLIMIGLGTFLGYYWGGQGFKPDFGGRSPGSGGAGQGDLE